MAEISLTKDLFLWCVSVIYLFGFASLFVQIPGLYGDNGILPARLVLENEAETFHDLITNQPTLLRLLPKVGLDLQTGMDFLCLGGAVLSFVAMISRDQRNSIVFALLWMFYLSLVQVGQTFLCHEWDILLLETGFLTIFIAPLNYFGLQDGTWHHSHDKISFWLIKWLLFRLTFASGVIKLISNSDSWWKLTEMIHQFETQLLPTPLAWYFYQMTDWLLKLMAVATLVIQIPISLLIFSPVKNLQILAFYSQCILMIGCILTGNYGFYPLLVLTLCLSLIDDKWLKSWTGQSSTNKTKTDNTCSLNGGWSSFNCGCFVAVCVALILGTLYFFSIQIKTSPLHISSDVAFSFDDLKTFLSFCLPVTILIGFISFVWECATTVSRFWGDKRLERTKKLMSLSSCIFYGITAFGIFSISLVPHTAIHKDTQAYLPQQLQDVYQWTSKHYHLTNPYTFLTRITDDENGRSEVVIEGSNQIGSEWKEYGFRFKPGNVTDAPSIVAPHHPRLDEQMWFAAKGQYEHNHWLLNLVYRLLCNQKEVLELIKENPFPDEPPQYIRATLYRYQFASKDRTSSRYSVSNWWVRKRIGEYLPVLTKDESSFVDYLKEIQIFKDYEKSDNPQNLLSRVMESIRSLFGQGSGSCACLVLVVTGLILTLLDPSIKFVTAEHLPNGTPFSMCNN